MFDADWFKSHQSSLLSWLNGSWLKRKLSRHALRIEATEPITEIAPSHYVVKLDETQRRASFYTHPKHAKRLYYSLIAYWWFLHFLDWAVLDRFVPQYSFGLATLTSTPGLGAGSMTGDGYIGRIVTAGSVYSTIIDAAAGTTLAMDGTLGALVRIIAHATTSDRYTEIRRSGFTFKTDNLGAYSTVTAVNLRLDSRASYQLNTFPTVNSDVEIVGFAPAIVNNFAVEDYSTFGATSFSTMSYADYTASEGHKTFTLNAAGIANVNKTGITGVGARLGSDLSGTGITWEAGGSLAVGVRWADGSGTVADPKLDVTYTEGSAPAYKPSAIIIS
jgi:hypothetical protein